MLQFLSPVKDFAFAEVQSPAAQGATAIVLKAGQGARMPSGAYKIVAYSRSKPHAPAAAHSAPVLGAKVQVNSVAGDTLNTDALPIAVDGNFLVYRGLTEEDWAAIDARLIGDGTTGKLARYIGTSRIGDSIISESATTITIAGLLDVNDHFTAKSQANFQGFCDFARAAGFLAQFRLTADATYRVRINSGGVIQWGDGASATPTLAMAGATVGTLGGVVLELSRTGAVGLDLNDGTEALSINASGGLLKVMSETFGGELLRITGGVATPGDVQVLRDLALKGPADTQPRLRWDFTNLKLLFGPGGAAPDVNLYRSAADVLKTDDDLVVGGDLTAASGYEHWVGQWTRLDVPASAIAGADNMDRDGSAAAIDKAFLIGRAGSVLGVAVAIDAGGPITQGSITVEVYVDGSATGLTVTIDSATSSAFASQAKDTDTFGAQSRLSLRVSSTSDLLPADAVDIVASLLVET